LVRRVTAAVRLTSRDRAVIRACWSLGAATAGVLQALTSPQTSVNTLRARLRQLRQAGQLGLVRYVAPERGLFLYVVGPEALEPGSPRPWRPSLSQVQHTIDVGSAVVALTRPGFAGLTSTTWIGEAELRGWAQPGAPFPDAIVRWTAPDAQGTWNVEVDRATETRAFWRRKLVRYLGQGDHDSVVLALTTSRQRALHLAQVSADVGVPLVAATLRAVTTSLDPEVLDTRTRRRVLLSQTLHS
jgi:Replication-relaxation